jgi:hypothetical protein
MRTEAKYIPYLRCGLCSTSGSKRSYFNISVGRPNYDLVDLVGSKAGELKRGFGDDEFLELEFQFLDIP